jgi:O-antigen/teichoic acid export membrane protein
MLQIRTRINRITQSEYIKNIAIVFSGTVIAQIISILLSPILSRLYDPNDFGIYALAMSIGVCIAAVVSSQYNNGIMLEEENNNAKLVVILSTLITILISLVLLAILAIIIFGFQFSFLEKVESAWILLPLYVFFSGVISSLNYWNNRNKQYKVISKGRVISTIVTIASQIFLAFIFQVTPLFLLLGLVLGQFCSFMYLVFSTSDLYKGLFENFFIVNVKSVALKHKRFLIFTSFSDLLDIFLLQLPIFILTKLVGTTQTGQFAFSNRLLAMPIRFVSSSVGEVFRQRAINENTQNGNCFNVFMKTFKGLFLISILPFMVLFIFAPDIFAFVFGEVWREAGVFTRIMVPMFFFKFTVSPLTYIYYISGKQKEDFILHILMLVLIVVSFYCGYEWFQSVNVALLFYSLCFVGIYVYYFCRSYILSKRSTG